MLERAALADGLRVCPVHPGHPAGAAVRDLVHHPQARQERDAPHHPHRVAVGLHPRDIRGPATPRPISHAPVCDANGRDARMARQMIRVASLCVAVWH
eukprot:3688779-Rhodomonas_salina.3